MTPRLLETVLREAAARAADSGDGSLPDADLLRRYAEDRDESSFAALVSRYGRVVWAVCRHSLPNEADAEDAFQATFLALSRGAGTVRSSLPGWLHGVAVKVCAQTRRSAGRRKVRDAKAAVSEAERPVAESAWDGLLAEVHAEVARLPAALRDAFVLVDLRGVSQPEAAKVLGWKAGTLSGRLCQARQFLIDRLTARGLAPAAALAGCGVGSVAANAAVPTKLFAAACAAGSANATIPVAVSLLASAALEGTLMLKTKLLAAGVMLAAATAITVATAQGPGAGEGAKSRTPEPRAGARDEQPPRETPRPGRGVTGGAPGQPGMSGGGMPGPGGMMPGGMGMGGMAGGFNPGRPGFEYKVIRVGLATMEKQLNDMGNESWELVAINGEGSAWFATFKRAKPVAFAGGGIGMMPGVPGGMPGMMGSGGGMPGGGAGGGLGGDGGRTLNRIPPPGRESIPDGSVIPPGLGGVRGGPGGGLSNMTRGRATIVSLDTPNLIPKVVAASINQIFNDHGISASEAPDGNGIVLRSAGNPDEVDRVKKFVAEYVEKAAARKKETERPKSGP